ncbi:MAG: enoyl-CoA hydratase-related protein, partial [Thermocrispum sp.]
MTEPKLDFELPELETLSLEQFAEGVVLLKLNRPDRMNSQTVRMFHEYGIVAKTLRDSSARALIVTGAGDRAFCAGFDTAEIGVLTGLGTREFLKFMETAAGGVAGIRQL